LVVAESFSFLYKYYGALRVVNFSIVTNF